VAKPGQNKGNRNAALKEGEFKRVQWTQSLSGENLKRLVRHLDIDASKMDEQEFQRVVASRAKQMFEEIINNLD